MKNLTFLLLILVLFSLGCDSTEPAPEYTIQDMFPLALGNQWTVQFTEYHTDGSVESIDTMLMRIDSSGNLNGHAGFHTTFSGEDFFFYYSGNDLFSVEVGDSSPYHALRYPMNVGDIVVTRDTLYQDNYRSKETMRLVSKNVAITVPAGEFTATQYELVDFYGPDGQNDTNSVSTLYVAPGVGLIQQNDYSHSPVKRMRSAMKLINYVVN